MVLTVVGARFSIVEAQLGVEITRNGGRIDPDAREPAAADGPIVPLHVKTVSGDVSIVRASEAVSA